MFRQKNVSGPYCFFQISVEIVVLCYDFIGIELKWQEYESIFRLMNLMCDFSK